MWGAHSPAQVYLFALRSNSGGAPAPFQREGGAKSLGEYYYRLARELKLELGLIKSQMAKNLTLFVVGVMWRLSALTSPRSIGFCAVLDCIRSISGTETALWRFAALGTAARGTAPAPITTAAAAQKRGRLLAVLGHAPHAPKLVQARVCARRPAEEVADKAGILAFSHILPLYLLTCT